MYLTSGAKIHWQVNFCGLNLKLYLKNKNFKDENHFKSYFQETFIDLMNCFYLMLVTAKLQITG